MVINKNVLYFMLIMFSSAFCQENSLRYCEYFSPRSFDPITSFNDLPNIRFCELTFKNLFDPLPENRHRFSTELIDDFDFQINNKKIVFSIKSNLQWSDGKAITPNDLINTYKAIQNSNNTNLKSVTRLLQKPELSGDNIVFNLNEITEERKIKEALTFKLLPSANLDVLPLRTEKFKENLVSFGPFKIQSLGNREIKLIKNESYYSAVKRPYIDEIQIKIRNDRGSQYSLFNSGITNLLLDIRPMDIAKFLSKSDCTVIEKNNYTIYVIAFNFKNPLLQEKEIRKGMTEGYNRQNVLDRHYQDKGDLLAGPYTNDSPIPVSDIKPLPYDKIKANDDLDKKYPRKYSGGLRTYKNADIRLSMIIQSVQPDDPINYAMKQFVSQMGSLGIEIELKPLEYSDYIRQIRNGDFDLAFVPLNFDNSYDITPLFHSSFIGSGKNFITYNNKYLDHFLDSMNTEKSSENQIRLGRYLQRYLLDQSPYMFLWTLQQAIVIKKYINDVPENMDSFTTFKYAEFWKIKK